MDYEVFLLSRIREDWLRTGEAGQRRARAGRDRTGHLVRGRDHGGRLPRLLDRGGHRGQARLGFGMAIAIVLDATVVRMVLVPATMALLGRWNWWLPAWLDRLLPSIDVEKDESPDDEVWDEFDRTDDTSVGAR